MTDAPILAVGTTIELDGYRRRVELPECAWLHALLTAVHGRGHDPGGPGTSLCRPAWSLVPWPSSSGWGVVWWDPDDGARLALSVHDGRLGRVPVRLRLGPAVRVYAPPRRARGEHLCVLETVTPVSIARVVDGERRTHEQPTSAVVTNALTTLARKIRSPTDGVTVEVVASQTRPTQVDLRGKPARVRGWVGRTSLRCSPEARWLLDVAARGLGLGARTAFGLGRVLVA